MKKRNWISLCLLLGLISALWYGTIVTEQGNSLSREVVRLHVLAASDSAEDQANKLRVRDAVLDCVAAELTAQTPDEAVARLRTLLPELAVCAQDELKALDCTDVVTVRLCREAYPTRSYGTFALPAGEYVSLQVRIGEAKGQNWWCVVYPNLCTAVQTDWAAEAARLDPGSVRMIKVEPERVVFRFRLLELLQKIKNRF